GAWRAFRLAQSYGAPQAALEARALQKGLSGEEAGELWRGHLEDLHGGVRRFSAVCDVSGRIGERSLSEQAMLTFRAPKDLTLEILGPLFAPVARARVDETGFAMDPFPVEGAKDGQVRESVDAVLSSVAGVLAGEPFLPGPAKLDSGWGRRDLDRPAWRVAIGDDGLARSATPAGGAPMRLDAFFKAGPRRIPDVFSGKGRFWEFKISCPDPKVETDPFPAPAEAR
ncbi:MAG: hypothetical protein KGM24_13545, partial [Elusimicrobia bacterium]|nr:hypothetical protein [Elusimicrobiota bacterium]